MQSYNNQSNSRSNGRHDNKKNHHYGPPRNTKYTKEHAFDAYENENEPHQFNQKNQHSNYKKPNPNQYPCN